MIFVHKSVSLLSEADLKITRLAWSVGERFSQSALGKFRYDMKTMHFLCMFELSLVWTCGCYAATPDEEAYLLDRARYVKVADSEVADKHNEKQKELVEQPLINNLQERLQKIIGPVKVKGYSTHGISFVQTLFWRDIGFELADGLFFKAAYPDRFEGDDGLVVTSPALFLSTVQRNLDLSRNESPTPTNPPAPTNVDEALRSEDFFSDAIAPDEHIYKFLELPVTRPAGPYFVYAMISMRTNDDPIGVPNELDVVVHNGNRVFIATKSGAGAGIRPIRACEAILAAVTKRDRDYNDKIRYVSPAEHDELLVELDRANAEAISSSRRCYRERLSSQPYFPKILDQAQDTISRILNR